MVDKRNVTEFEWDSGNLDKSYQKHDINPSEAEEVFLDTDLKVESDVKHSQKEKRFIAIGKTFQQRLLFVVFTLRGKKIRIISARIANKKERAAFAKATAIQRRIYEKKA